MFLTGYHGTSSLNAHNIIKTGKYNISKGDRDWLGPGIYFYPKFGDAYEWRDSEVVLHSVLNIKESEFLDIDSKEGQIIYNDAVKMICSMMRGKPSKKQQENQCALMRIIWDVCPDIQVISAEFAKEPTIFPTLIDKRPRRKEFCVRNNEPIKLTQLIRKEDVG